MSRTGRREQMRFLYGPCLLIASFALVSARSQTGQVVTAIDCGRTGSPCEILAQGIPNPRSLSKVLPDGSFFVASAGSPFQDLFGEAVAGTGTDVDSSAIFRYTEAGGLQPWVTPRPSQLITVFDPSFGGFVPYQAGITGVEVAGGDLLYAIAYNRGASNYVDRMRSYTVETGLSFAEVRRIAGGVSNPNGAETVIADIGKAELANNNPDGVLHSVDNLTHKAGDPEFESNPFGVLPDASDVFVMDAAGNTLYRIRPNGKIDLHTVFTRFVQARQPVPTNLLRGPDAKLYGTLFHCANVLTPGAAGAIVEIRPNGTIQAVSFHSLPIAAAFGPDGFLYVLEYGNLVSPLSGRVLRTTPRQYGDFNGRPASDGTVVVDKLNFPIDVEFDRQGRLLILEGAELDPFKTNGRILRVRLF